MRPPKVMVLYNVPTLPLDHPDADSEHDVLDTVSCIASIYEQAGLAVERFGFQYDLRALQDAIATRQPDVIFNLYEGTAEWPQSEALVAAALELTRVPFTGSPAIGHHAGPIQATHKIRAGRCRAGHAPIPRN